MKLISKKMTVKLGILMIFFFNIPQGFAQNKFYQLGEQLVEIAKSGNADKLVDYIDEKIKLEKKAKIMESFLTLKGQMFTMVNKEKIQFFNALKQNNNIYIILTDNKNFAIIKSTVNNKDKIIDIFTYLNTKKVSELVKGKKIYKTRCYSCHGKFAKGGIGPNLTDNYWKFINSPQDFYNIIANGKKGTMMIAYKNYLNPEEINLVMTYIKALHNKKQINPKKPEGEKKELNLSIFK